MLGYPVDTDSFSNDFLANPKISKELIRFLVQWANWNTWCPNTQLTKLKKD